MKITKNGNIMVMGLYSGTIIHTIPSNHKCLKSSRELTRMYFKVNFSHLEPVIKRHTIANNTSDIWPRKKFLFNCYFIYARRCNILMEIFKTSFLGHIISGVHPTRWTIGWLVVAFTNCKGYGVVSSLLTADHTCQQSDDETLGMNP